MLYIVSYSRLQSDLFDHEVADRRDPGFFEIGVSSLDGFLSKIDVTAVICPAIESLQQIICAPE